MNLAFLLCDVKHCNSTTSLHLFPILLVLVVVNLISNYLNLQGYTCPMLLYEFCGMSTTRSWVCKQEDVVDQDRLAGGGDQSILWHLQTTKELLIAKTYVNHLYWIPVKMVTYLYCFSVSVLKEVVFLMNLPMLLFLLVLF